MRTPPGAPGPKTYNIRIDEDSVPGVYNFRIGDDGGEDGDGGGQNIFRVGDEAAGASSNSSTAARCGVAPGIEFSAVVQWREKAAKLLTVIIR